MSFAWRDSPVCLLFTWARWLSLKHPTIGLVNLQIPLLGLVVTLVFFAVLPGVNFTKDLGVIQQVNGLLQILAPFFVAALALIAAFPGEALDKRMGGNQPFRMIENEKYFPTRREVLGYMFSYLAELSVIIYLCGGIIVSVNSSNLPYNINSIVHGLRGWIPFIFKGIYGAVMLHLFATTLLGLHFLGNFLSASQTARTPSPVVPTPPIDPPTALPSSAPRPRQSGKTTNWQTRNRAASRSS